MIPTYDKAADVFATGPINRFKAENAKGEHLTYLFKIKDAGDWLVAVDDGTCSVTANPPEDTKANVVISMTEADMLDVANGREGLQLLFMTGRLQVEGDLSSALKIVRFFPRPV